MNARFKTRFIKDIEKLPSADVKQQVAAIIKAVEDAGALADVPNVKKMAGFKTAYRIRVGDFRIGVVVVENDVLFVRMAHRRDIYRFFP